MKTITLAMYNKSEAEVKRLTALLEAHGINPNVEDVKDTPIARQVTDSLKASLQNIRDARITRIQ
jgi:arsenate reductase-like glutaredoxin family protein